MKSTPEESLDPKDWDEFKRLAHQALEDSLDYLAALRDRPVWQPIPAAVKAELKAPPPRAGRGETAAYREYQRLVAPYPSGNIHPRFWGWVNGSGTPVGLLAELLTATLNTNSAGFEQSSTYVELQVLDWFRELMGFPATGSGILTSGGSLANLIGVNVARSAKAPFAVRRDGVSGQPRLRYYTSTETHNSVQKALELMGLGAESLASIPVDAEYRMDMAALKACIVEDRRAGHLPICVVANAGTVNTGAIDPLDAIADLCKTENLWLHVDGAFGAMAALDPASRDLVKGIERADSLAFDLHKWMHIPYDAGCTLVRDRETHRAAFAIEASYLNKLSGGIAALPPVFSDYGPQLSRGFRALKVWMNLMAYGVDKFGRLVAQNVQQARYLKERVEAEPELELLAPVPLNIVNFRYRGKDLGEPELNGLNGRILVALQERGIAAPSSTVLKGRFAIRAAITNHRSRREDFDALVEGTLALGREFSA